MLQDLPFELRAQIYEYLLPDLPLGHPVESTAITSVSPRPPSLSLLLLCHSLTEEVLSNYYRHALYKLVLSHAFNFYRNDPNLDNLSKHPILQKIQNVELVFFCDGVLVRDYPSFGPDRACQEVRRRAERAVEVLEHAASLKKVVVSWVDPGRHWGVRAEVVTPLRPLRKMGIKLEVGEVLGVEDAERDKLMRALKTELSCDTAVVGGFDYEPHSIRVKREPFQYGGKDSDHPLSLQPYLPHDTVDESRSPSPNLRRDKEDI
ncbi:MAG: hypothetical protein M1821_007034 [Bathelium mastoideum]|nr:MAG: hypothetical protein M1821_007034 [Bathelium mastoideum]